MMRDLVRKLTDKLSGLDRKSLGLLFSSLSNRGYIFLLLAASFRILPADDYAHLLLILQLVNTLTALIAAPLSVLGAKDAEGNQGRRKLVIQVLLWICLWYAGLNGLAFALRDFLPALEDPALPYAFGVLAAVSLRSAMVGFSASRSRLIVKSSIFSSVVSFAIPLVLWSMKALPASAITWLSLLILHPAIEACFLTLWGGQKNDESRSAPAAGPTEPLLRRLLHTALPGSLTAFFGQGGYLLVMLAADRGDPALVIALGWAAQLRAPLALYASSAGFAFLTEVRRRHSAAQLSAHWNGILGRALGLGLINVVLSPLVLFFLGDTSSFYLLVALSVLGATYASTVISLVGWLLVGVDRDWIATANTFAFALAIFAGLYSLDPRGLSLPLFYFGVSALWAIGGYLLRHRLFHLAEAIGAEAR